MIVRDMRAILLMEMKNITLIIFTLFILFSFVACTNVQTTTVKSETSISPAQQTSVANKTSVPSPEFFPSESELYPVYTAILENTYPLDVSTVVLLEDLQPPLDTLPPEPGCASISGLLYAYDISKILMNTEFWLYPAVTVGDKKVIPPIITNGSVKDGDVNGKTDENGVFFLDNVPPGDYYLIINYPDHTVVGQSKPTAEAYLLISISEGDRIPLGVIFTLR